MMFSLIDSIHIGSGKIVGIPTIMSKWLFIVKRDEDGLSIVYFNMITKEIEIHKIEGTKEGRHFIGVTEQEVATWYTITEDGDIEERLILLSYPGYQEPEIKLKGFPKVTQDSEFQCLLIPGQEVIAIRQGNQLYIRDKKNKKEIKETLVPTGRDDESKPEKLRIYVEESSNTQECILISPPWDCERSHSPDVEIVEPGQLRVGDGWRISQESKAEQNKVQLTVFHDKDFFFHSSLTITNCIKIHRTNIPKMVLFETGVDNVVELRRIVSQ